MRSTMKFIAGMSVFCAVVLFASHEAWAVCSSGGTVSNINDCVPGGSSVRDCLMEFSATPIPPLDNNGLPSKKLTCYDNGNMCSVSRIPCLADSDCPVSETCSVPCDLDKTPGQCTFKVGFCFNVNDSRLSSCTPGQTDEVTLKKPSENDAIKAHKNPFGRNNRRNLFDPIDALVPTATPDACTDEGTVVVPLKRGTKKGKQVVKAISLDNVASAKDADALKLTCLPNPNIASLPISSCRQISSASELIGGAVAVGRVGDWLLENDKIRVIVRDVGRAFSFTLTHGGHIVDADLVRPPSKCSTSGGPCSVDSDCPPSETCIPEGRDNFIGMTPLINVSSSDEPMSIGCLNDGSSGGTAVLQTMGQDDLFDPVNPAVAIKMFSTSLAIPPKAVDVDIPVTVENLYSLEPGKDYVKIETAITNNATPGTCAAPPSNFGNSCAQDSDCDDPGGSGNGQCGDLELYIGDYLNGGGHVDEVAPGLGFGNIPVRVGNDPVVSGKVSLDWIAFTGVGEAQGVSYGIIPELFDLTGAFSDSGVTVPVYGQPLVAILLGGAPAVFTVPPGETRSFIRYFVVGDGGAEEVMDARNQIFDVRRGYVQGTVKVDGVPQDGARVSIIKGVLPSGDLISTFETSDGGFYQGTLPVGTYKVMAKVPGVPHLSSTEQTATIKGGTTVVDFNLTPEPAYLKVVATDGVTMGSLPVKVSVVGLKQSDPVLSKAIALFGVTVSGGAFGTDVSNKVRELPFGLAAVGFAGPNGILGDPEPFQVPPGDYQIVVSHGPEYSVYKQNVTLTSGATEVVNATLVPVVDTSGFISQDAHVHMISSPDSAVTKKERIFTMLAEGVDHFVASDHDFVTDLTPELTALGAFGLIQFSPSDEITPFDIGHFGAYPLTPNPASTTGGAVDWGGGPGYPSGGSYGLTPAQIIAAARAQLGAIVVQVNHFYSYFEFAGVDTRTIPPVSSTDNTLIRQDPAATNLFTSDMDALEVWIENTRPQNDRFRGENLGDWINLLNGFDATNPDMRFTGVADSDTHQTVVIQAAGPRTFVASSTDTPGLIDRTEIANNLIEGRAIGSNAPYVKVEVLGDLGNAGLDLGSSLLARTSTGTVNVHVNVQSPTWAEFDRIEIFANSVPTCTTSPHPFLGGQKAICNTTPTLTLNKGTDFTVSTVPINGDSRLEADVTKTLTVGATDTWVLVVVRGTDNKSKPLFPITPLDIHRKACSLDPCQECTTNSDCPGTFNTCNDANTTLAQLTDGNLGQCGVLAQAFTNPLFIDADGDGEYKGVPFP